MKNSTQASAPDVYRAAGQTLHNNNSRWFVEDDYSGQVRHVGDGDFRQSYDECVSWLQWYRDGIRVAESCTCGVCTACGHCAECKDGIAGPEGTFCKTCHRTQRPCENKS